jgi:orotate phosphoribosyltransferase
LARYAGKERIHTGGNTVGSLRDQAITLVKERGYERRDTPFKLASGHYSFDYIDGKYAVDNGERLALVSRAIIELAAAHEMAFTAVGGLTMGADALAHGVSLLSGSGWFSVRKEPKPRGREQWIEGCRLTAAERVLLVDDVVTMGGSILKAYDRVRQTGAAVVGVIPMVDRGESGRQVFADLDVVYEPLMTYRDLGIEPVNGSPVVASTS